MAFGSNEIPPSAAGPASEPVVDVSKWAAAHALHLSIGGSGPAADVPLMVPLGSTPTVQAKRPVVPQLPQKATNLRCRDVMAEGREGTRRRRRWENDNFKNVPNAQPPQASDWVIQPTHPVVHVPYHLAKYWDEIVASKALSQAAKAAKGPGGGRGGRKKTVDEAVGRIPRDVRDAAKRSPIFKTWVRDVEEPVRWFAQAHQADHVASVSASVSSLDSSVAAGVASMTSSITDLAGDLTPRARSPAESLEIISPGRDVSGDDYAYSTADDFASSSSDEDGGGVLVSGGTRRGRAREPRDGIGGGGGGSGIGSLEESIASMQAAAHAQQPFGRQRRSVLALQRDEDWQELLPVGGGRSRGGTGTTTVSRDQSVSSGMWDMASWRVVPGRSKAGGGGGATASSGRADASDGPAAMLFAPDQGSNSTFKRWIVHSVAVYYGLESTSVDDGEAQRGRYVFVAPKTGGKSAGRAGFVPGRMWEQL